VKDRHGEIKEGTTELSYVNNEYQKDSIWSIEEPKQGYVGLDTESWEGQNGLRWGIPSLLRVFDSKHTDGLSKLGEKLTDMILAHGDVYHYDRSGAEWGEDGTEGSTATGPYPGTKWGPARIENCDGSIWYTAAINVKGATPESSYEFAVTAKERPSMPVWQLMDHSTPSDTMTTGPADP
jgi:hypothetical protein